MDKEGLILDNQRASSSLGEYLRKKLKSMPAAMLRMVSAYFTISAYEQLEDELRHATKLKFLYGTPHSVGEVNPDKRQHFALTEKGIAPMKVLQQKSLARRCKDWIQKKVEVRTIKHANFLHGKLYHLEEGGNSIAVMGSSNFTYPGLGFGEARNIELNMKMSDEASAQLKAWFEHIWENKDLVKDAKKDLLEALEALSRDYTPEFVYFKTLFEAFKERLDEREQQEQELAATHLPDTKIWKTLYPFQQVGVHGIIQRLKEYNGCILADSVGLGKTYTALAVIKHFEDRNKHVLVLCPKKLRENWALYQKGRRSRNNPFSEDGFEYELLSHTDLTREKGESGGINLADFTWENYDLVVIDESHNFRNETKSRRDEEGNIRRYSRYERLLNDVLKAGKNTKVLMLSATPINTSPMDLRNQLYLMTKKEDDAFKEKLGIASLNASFGRAQKAFKAWEKDEGKKDKRVRLEQLDADLDKLSNAVSISRSRPQIKKAYPQFIQDIGDFPTQANPQNESPHTDLKKELSYKELGEQISKFRLSIYMPSSYVTSQERKEELKAEKEKLNFNQKSREHWLIGMMQVNFMKRLESSPHSLSLTLGRTLQKIDDLICLIHKFQSDSSSNLQLKDYASPEEEEDVDEEFLVGKGHKPYHLKDLNLGRWSKDLEKDREALRGAWESVKKVTPARDGKLASLKEQVEKKIKNPTKDKDGRENRKLLIFTAFADTVEYLYEHLKPMAEDLGVHIAMVTGSESKTTYGRKSFHDILTNFAPMGRSDYRKQEEGGTSTLGAAAEIDILLATDCVSEGQNLQDCDLVVNYDIHWNPVRIVQRFGRIDRMGSRSKKVGMINYWPTQELDDYLRLKSRVEARMALVDAAAIGDGNKLEELKEKAQTELNRHDKQLERLRKEPITLDDMEDGLLMSDVTLDDFVAQLRRYMKKDAHRTRLEQAPLGVYALSHAPPSQSQEASAPVRPGVIFCLRQRNTTPAKHPANPLYPYCLVYIQNDGTVRYSLVQVKQLLTMYSALCVNKSTPIQALVDAFEQDTQQGKNMDAYEKLLKRAIHDMITHLNQHERKALTQDRHAILSRHSEKPIEMTHFELVTWLIIK